MYTKDDFIEILRRSVLDDLFKDFRERRRWARQLLEPLAWSPAGHFAHLAAAFDHDVAQLGFRAAIQRVLPNFVSAVDVQGSAGIPEEGPLLVVSNHPGTCDSLAIAAALPRDDLQIVAFGFPLLRQLPAARQHLIFASHDISERMAVVRAGIRHLRQGGALLIFPRGRVEPDPAVAPGAPESVQAWSPSLEILTRQAPDARVLVTIVSDVLRPGFIRNPLNWMWRGQRDPLVVAETLQTAIQMLFPRRVQVRPRIYFDLPSTVDELRQRMRVEAVRDAIVLRAQQLLAQRPEPPQVEAQAPRHV